MTRQRARLTDAPAGPGDLDVLLAQTSALAIESRVDRAKSGFLRHSMEQAIGDLRDALRAEGK